MPTGHHPAMLSYEVTIVLEDPSLAEPLTAYMREKHLREVFATGCFLDAHFEQSAPDVFRSRYSVASQEDLDRYIADHSSALRADFLERFPSGVRVSRSVWTQLADDSGSGSR